MSVQAINGRAQRSLTLQQGNSLISLALTLSVGFSISTTLHAATQANRLRQQRDFPHLTESHPMDHDSNSSGHTLAQVRPEHRATLFREVDVDRRLSRNQARPQSHG